MKLVGIGDLFVPCWAISRGFAELAPHGVQVETVEWRLDGFDQLQAINLQVEQRGSDAVEPPEEIFAAAAEAEILITHFCPVTRRLIEASPRLKVIGVLRGGYENVNFAYARERGLLVFNTPGRNADAVADFTVGMMIAEARNIARGHHGLKNGEWIRTYPNYQHIPDLPGRTVGPDRAGRDRPEGGAAAERVRRAAPGLRPLRQPGAGRPARRAARRPGRAAGRRGLRVAPRPSHRREPAHDRAASWR